MKLHLFWKKINKTDTCWLWTGGTRSYRYGVFRVSGRKAMAAHRIMYELTFGPIPAGKEIMHTCDNVLCVNPSHLRCVTHHENMLDMKNKHRAKRTMTVEKRAKVWPLRAAGLTQREIAARLGCSQTHIGKILRGLS